MVRVVVLEDQRDVREGVARLIGGAEGFSLVGVWGTLAQFDQALDAGLDFELALIDLQLTDGSGIAALSRLRRDRRDAVGVVFTVFDDDERIFEALSAGARGYVLKNTAPRRLLSQLSEAAAGGAPLTPSIARRVVERFSTAAPAEPGLTPRELDVLRLLVEGLTYAETGERLGVSLNTVQTHVRSIYEKLEVSSKAEATRVAVRKGLVLP